MTIPPRAFFPLLVAALAALTFLPVLHADFVNYDDLDNFVRNPAIRALGPRNLGWMFTTTLAGHWAPLTWISHALDYQVSGLDPGAFHRTNLLLHALNAGLACILASAILALARPREAAAHPVALQIAAAIAALFFAVHPLRAESVGWITERRGLLCASFLLLALLAYLRACAPGKAALASRGWFVASILCFALSLLAKGIGMTFAAILVVLDLYPLRRPPVRTVWAQKIPFLALGLASAAVSSWAARAIPGTVKTLEAWGPAARIGQALYGLAFYVRKTVFPDGLVPVVELPARFDFAEPRFLASAIGVALAALGIVLARKRAPGLCAAAAVYVLVLAPVLGLMQAGPQLVADRYSYLACMPWAFLLGGGILLAVDRWPKRASAGLVAGSAAAIVLLAVLANAQASVWRDSRTLWSHALEVGGPSSVAHVNLGGLALEAGDDARAMEHYLRAIEANPEQGLAWFNLGILHARAGRFADAERCNLEAVRTMKPAFLPLVNLGNLYRNRMGRLDDAIAAYRRAVADAEHGIEGTLSPVPYLVLGAALQEKGLREEGRAYLEFAARHPDTRAEALRELER